MTLGELIDKLELCDPDQEIRLANGDFIGRFTSYRGTYAHLALENGTGYQDGFEEQGYIKHENVGQLLATARATVGQEMQGYKGGDYVMTRDTPIWLAEWGDSNNVALLDIVPITGDQGQFLRYVLRGYNIESYLF